MNELEKRRSHNMYEFHFKGEPTVYAYQKLSRNNPYKCAIRVIGEFIHPLHSGESYRGYGYVGYTYEVGGRIYNQPTREKLIQKYFKKEAQSPLFSNQHQSGCPYGKQLAKGYEAHDECENKYQMFDDNTFTVSFRLAAGGWCEMWRGEFRTFAEYYSGENEDYYEKGTDIWEVEEA
jgi:hypothetical protein|tara:strand:- start:28 stop:558 length:531 start_codon:yes stop_codon:yes gene_type:complete